MTQIEYLEDGQQFNELKIINSGIPLNTQILLDDKHVRYVHDITFFASINNDIDVQLNMTIPDMQNESIIEKKYRLYNDNEKLICKEVQQI